MQPAEKVAKMQLQGLAAAMKSFQRDMETVRMECRATKRWSKKLLRGEQHLESYFGEDSGPGSEFLGSEEVKLVFYELK